MFDRTLSTHPVDVGLRSEAVILGQLVARGYRVLVPFGFNHRYDLVIDLSDRFVRAQCKTGRMLRGALVFSTQSVRCNTHQVLWRTYHGEVDIFLVFCPKTQRVFVVDIADTGRRETALRILPAANGQTKGIRWAVDHLLGVGQRAVAALPPTGHRLGAVPE